jgi:hypothetical protein
MADKPKHKLPQHTVDFVTALSVQDCRERLARELIGPVNKGLDNWLAPMEQDTQLLDDKTFVIERSFPGALHPIRLVGHLDPREDAAGTWVHGGVTHDAYHQVIVEGLIAFLGFFLLSALFFLRLRSEGALLAVVIFLPVLAVLMRRWRALNAAAEDAVRWVRRRLYVTRDQVGGGG